MVSSIKPVDFVVPDNGDAYLCAKPILQTTDKLYKLFHAIIELEKINHPEAQDTEIREKNPVYKILKKMDETKIFDIDLESHEETWNKIESLNKRQKSIENRNKIDKNPKQRTYSLEELFKEIDEEVDLERSNINEVKQAKCKLKLEDDKKILREIGYIKDGIALLLAPFRQQEDGYERLLELFPENTQFDSPHSVLTSWMFIDNNEKVGREYLRINSLLGINSEGGDVNWSEHPYREIVDKDPQFYKTVVILYHHFMKKMQAETGKSEEELATLVIQYVESFLEKSPLDVYLEQIFEIEEMEKETSKAAILQKHHVDADNPIEMLRYFLKLHLKNQLEGAADEVIDSIIPKNATVEGITSSLKKELYQAFLQIEEAQKKLEAEIIELEKSYKDVGIDLVNRAVNPEKPISFPNEPKKKGALSDAKGLVHMLLNKDANYVLEWFFAISTQLRSDLLHGNRTAEKRELLNLCNLMYVNFTRDDADFKKKVELIIQSNLLLDDYIGRQEALPSEPLTDELQRFDALLRNMKTAYEGYDFLNKGSQAARLVDWLPVIGTAAGAVAGVAGAIVGVKQRNYLERIPDFSTDYNQQMLNVIYELEDFAKNRQKFIEQRFTTKLKSILLLKSSWKEIYRAPKENMRRFAKELKHSKSIKERATRIFAATMAPLSVTAGLIGMAATGMVKGPTLLFSARQAGKTFVDELAAGYEISKFFDNYLNEENPDTFLLVEGEIRKENFISFAKPLIRETKLQILNKKEEFLSELQFTAAFRFTINEWNSKSDDDKFEECLKELDLLIINRNKISIDNWSKFDDNKKMLYRNSYLNYIYNFIEDVCRAQAIIAINEELDKMKSHLTAIPSEMGQEIIAEISGNRKISKDFFDLFTKSTDEGTADYIKKKIREMAPSIPEKFVGSISDALMEQHKNR